MNSQILKSQDSLTPRSDWISLVLNDQNVLFYCFHEIFHNTDFLTHYDQEESYFHMN